MGIPSLQALASLDRSHESLSTQLEAAASILGVDLPNLAVAIEADPNYSSTLKKSHAFREQRVLKWLLKKLTISTKTPMSGSLAESDQAIQEFVLEEKTWLLFFYVVSTIPGDVLEEILTEREFFQKTTQHAGLLLAQPFSRSPADTTLSRPVLDVDGERPKKKRKVSTTTDESGSPEVIEHKQVMRLLVYLKGISRCANVLAHGQDDGGSGETHKSFTWTGSFDDAAALAGKLLRITHVIGTTSVSPALKALLPPLAVDVLALWHKSATLNKDSDKSERYQAFNGQVLAPVLLLLDSFKHGLQRENAKSAIESLEKLIAINTVLPLRTTFFTKHSSNWRQRRQALSWKNVEPIFEDAQTTLSPCLSLYHELENPKGPRLSVAMSSLFDIAMRIIPMSNLRHKQREQPWLDAFFLVLAYLSLPTLAKLTLKSGKYSSEATVSSSTDTGSALEPLVRVASSRNTSPSSETLAYLLCCVIASVGKDLPPWQLVGNLLSVEEQILLHPTQLNIDENGTPDSTVLDCVNDWLRRSRALDQDTFSLLRDHIVIPLMRVLVRNREMKQFIKLWEDHLVEASHWRISNADNVSLSGSVVFEQPEVFEQVQHFLHLQALPEAGYQLLDTVLDQMSTSKNKSLEQQLRRFAGLAILETYVKALPEDFTQHRLERLTQAQPILEEIAVTEPDTSWQRWRAWQFLRTLHGILSTSSEHILRTDVPRAALDCVTFGAGTGNSTRADIIQLAKNASNYMEAFQYFAFLVDLAPSQEVDEWLARELESFAKKLETWIPDEKIGVSNPTQITYKDELIYTCLVYACSHANVLRRYNQTYNMATALPRLFVRCESDSSSAVLDLLETLLRAEACVNDGKLFRACLDAAVDQSNKSSIAQEGRLTALQLRIAKILPIHSLKKAFTKDLGRNHLEALREKMPSASLEHSDPAQLVSPFKSLSESKTQLLSLLTSQTSPQVFENNGNLWRYVREAQTLVDGLNEKHLADLLQLLREDVKDAKHASLTPLLAAPIILKSAKVDLQNEPKLVEELVLFASGKAARQAHSSPELLIHLNCCEVVLEKLPGVVNQSTIDTILESIAIIASSQFSSKGFESSIEQQVPASAIYDRLCALLGSVLNRYRLRLSDRFHLLLAVLQALLRCLFHPGTDKSRIAQTPAQAASRQAFLKSLPPWLTSSTPLPPSSAQHFTRLLSSICNPTVSAARSSRSRTKPKTTADLNDETQKAKKIAGQHMQYLLMEYCKCTLDGQIAVDVKEKLLPGLYSVLDAMSRDLMKAMNAQMDPSSRAIFKGLYDDWVRFGKWDQT